MTDKLNNFSGSASRPMHPTAATLGGQTVTSPFDAPTGQLPVPPGGAHVPLTDDELGLDLDVPTVGEAGSPGGAATTYSFASIPPAPIPPTDTVRMRRIPEYRRGTQDLGLFGLRLLVGLSFVYHGIQKLTTWFGGRGLDGTRQLLEQGGWKHYDVIAAVLGSAEVAGGVLIVLGLATPLAAGAVLATVTDAWLWKQAMQPGLQYTAVELESILAAATAVLILTGPGRLAFDRNRGWAVRPAWGSFVCLLLGLAVAAAAWIFLHGGNPFR